MEQPIYEMTLQEKLQIKLLTENLRRVMYLSMILAIGIPVVFVLFLLFPVRAELRNAFYGLTVGAELAVVVYFIIAGFAVERKQFRQIELTVHSFWAVLSFFGYSISFILYLSFGDLTLYYLTLAAVSLGSIMSSTVLAMYMIPQGILALVMVVLLKMSPYQFVWIVIVNGMFILLSRVLYRAQASACEMRQQMNVMKKDAAEDPLTGLLNRRGLEKRLEAIWESAAKQKRLIAAIIIDIDYFKKYNDSFGHPEGDHCLKIVAEIIKQTTADKTQMVSRIGGEEFMIILHETDEKQPVKIAEQLRASIERRCIPQSPVLANPYVTISVGVAAIIPKEGSTYNQLYDQADKALYCAKKGGRNRVVYNPHIR